MDWTCLPSPRIAQALLAEAPHWPTYQANNEAFSKRANEQTPRARPFMISLARFHGMVPMVGRAYELKLRGLE